MNKISSLPYLLKINVRHEQYEGCTHSGLILGFTHKIKVLSTLEGMKEGIENLGNCNLPVEFWKTHPDFNVAELKQIIPEIYGLPPLSTSMLYTGVQMDSLICMTKKFREMSATVFITAGIHSNAMHMGLDLASYYELDPAEKKASDGFGTINIILLTNCDLTERAMTRAIITITEAKSAALQVMGIHSTFQPNLPATGTGTDNCIIVKGEGPRIDNTGGHCKMGEIIAHAVFEGVQQAVQIYERLHPLQ